MYMYYIDDFFSISVSISFQAILFLKCGSFIFILHVQSLIFKYMYISFLLLFKKYYKTSKNRKYPNYVKTCTGVPNSTSISADPPRTLYNFTADSGQFSSTRREMMSPMRSVRLHFSILLTKSARYIDLCRWVGKHFHGFHH